MPNKNLIALELKKIREKYGLTNESWSKKSGVPVSTIARYCSASSLNVPNVLSLGSMLDCVNESLDDFYRRVTAKVDNATEALKLGTVPTGITRDVPVEVPEAKAEIQERIILQAEEIQKMKALDLEKDMHIELLEVRLETLERTLEAVKALCSAK